jgi:phosphopentomutase
MKRVFIFVLDSLGIGAMPDAQKFGDTPDCNTLKRISKSPFFSIPNLVKLGIGNIEGVDYLDKAPDAPAAVFRMAEASNGKDTTIGHWEIAGVISENPMPTYPNGFPKEIISEFCEKTGRKVLCNLPYSGTEVIKE